MPEPVTVGGAGVVSPVGFDGRGLASALRRPHLGIADDLQGTHGEVEAGQVPPIPSDRDAGDRRAHKLMSRAARLAAVAARACLGEVAWEHRDEVGFYLGVGASAARINELEAVLRASYVEGALSMERLGAKGLRAFNPLRTFMLLPSFTMCHSALLEGTTGPNGTYFSRGTGTVIALMEACHQIRSGACERALCGGADSALHPLTWAELIRDGRVAEGFVPGEGAAVLALSRGGAEEAVTVGHVSIHPTAAAAVEAIGTGIDLCVSAPWGPASRSALAEVTGAAWPGAVFLDVTGSIGDALAATPALAWSAAVDWLRQHGGRAAVLSAGLDGGYGAAVFEGGSRR
jgi:3-oxoacyl-(acyl-carrier-protein) synthase